MLKAGIQFTTNADIVLTELLLEVTGVLVRCAKHIGGKEVAIDINNPPWPDGWKREGKRGRLTNRISAWLKKETGHNLPDHILSHIGNVLCNAIIEPGVSITITDKFDWNPGEYGDARSCFFKSRRQVFPYLHHMGGRAALVRFPDGKQARCLLAETDDDTTVAFNSYGAQLLRMGVVMAHIASQQTGRRHIPIKKYFSVAGNGDVPVYINDNAAVGMWPADIEELPLDYVRESDLPDWQDGWTDIIRCENCFERLAAHAPHTIERVGRMRYAVHVCKECAPEVLSREGAKWTGTISYALRIQSYPKWSSPPQSHAPSPINMDRVMDQSRWNWIELAWNSMPPLVQDLLGRQRYGEVARDWLAITHPRVVDPWSQVSVALSVEYLVMYAIGQATDAEWMELPAPHNYCYLSQREVSLIEEILRRMQNEQHIDGGIGGGAAGDGPAGGRQDGDDGEVQF